MSVHKDNLVDIEFTAQEVQQLENAFDTISRILEGKTINLTPLERKRFGRVAEFNKLFIDKARQFIEKHPQYNPPYLDRLGYEKDYQARRVIGDFLSRAVVLREKLGDTKIALDNDNYKASLGIYGFVKLLAAQNIPGISTWLKELKQFFPRRKRKK